MNCAYCNNPLNTAGTCYCFGATNARERRLGPDEITPAQPHVVSDLAREEVLVLRARVAELEARQTEHLALIAQLSRTMPYEDEVKQLHSRIGALMAEVGTLRAQLSAAKKVW